MVRKHQGIIQTGKNKGKLKKGYYYTGDKTNSGLPIIKKNKNSNDIKNFKGGSSPNPLLIINKNNYFNYDKVLEPSKNNNNSEHYVKISELSHKNRAYIFPRNGFLLGVVRHYGYLPNEDLDPDLACLERDIPKILNSDWDNYIIKPTSGSNGGTHWDTDFNNGKHPITQQNYEYYNLKITDKNSNFSDTIMIYHTLNDKYFIYPWYSVKDFNSEREFNLAKNHYSKSNGGSKIYHNNEIIPIDKLYTNKEYLGKVFKFYKKEYFDKFYQEKFYDKYIYIPINSREILKADYGEDVFDIMINKNGERIPIIYK